VKVVSVINHKGGVGKTTLTANLGAGLAARGRKVLLVDLDAQGSLTVSFFTQSEWSDELMPAHTIKHWYDGLGTDAAAESLADAVATPPRVKPLLGSGTLDLIPAHRDLADIDTALAAELLSDTDGYLAVHRRLSDGLSDKAFGEYDVVLIDCAPNFGLIAKNAIAASDALLIPTRPDYLSTNGIDSLGRKVQAFAEEYNEHLGRAGATDSPPIGVPPADVVFTMVQLHDGEPIEAQRNYISRVQALGIPTFETAMRDSKSVYGPAPEHGVPVILGGTSRALTRELRELVSEFAARLERIPS
jgi:chromosome partitioning protein